MATPRRRCAAALSAFTSLAGLAAAQPPDSTPPPPNVLVILADDMGFGDLGCYGSRQIPTPRIDELADSGVRCTQGYVTAAACAPSRAGLLVGRYQSRFGFEHNLIGSGSPYNDESLAIPREEKTIADRLGSLGYRTGIIGKWHVGQTAEWHHPNARGFDEFFGMLKGNHTYFPTVKNQLSRGRDPVTEISEPYLTEWFTTEALAFIDRAKQDKPWFLYLAYNTPHTPLQAKREDLDRFAHIKPKRRRIYCAMQSCLDRQIGRILDHLERKGQRERTLIVFTNDNGGPCNANASINAPLRGQKGILLEGGIRVPFLWSWPGHIPAGKTYDKPVISLDILPTALAAAGSRLTPETIGRGRSKRARIYDGVDLLPFFRGEQTKRPPHETLYWRMSLRGAAIRDGDLKLIRLPHRGPQLYDLSRDPSELHDLGTKRPKDVARLLGKLHDWECSLERPPMWIGSNSWMKKNRALYDREYTLEQPKASQ